MPEQTYARLVRCVANRNVGRRDRAREVQTIEPTDDHECRELAEEYEISVKEITILGQGAGRIPHQPSLLLPTRNAVEKQDDKANHWSSVSGEP
jgi:hypothetical protein